MQLNNVLIKPLVSEKTMAEAKGGRYAFAVALAATKMDVKGAVEKLWGVKVKAVQTAIMAGKSGRRNRRGKTSVKADWKKAIVSIAAGQKIDLDYGA